MTNLSRRNFLKGAAVSALGMAAMGKLDLAVAKAEEAVKTSPVAPVFLDTPKGKIMGFVDGAVYRFLGVPYGKAERFEMPVAPDAWEGIVKCIYPGEVCPQDRTLDYSSVNIHEFATPAYKDLCANEDTCLNLNVWTKTMDTAAKKPVIVFMHGGGLNNGSSVELDTYDAQYFTDLTDCVFVSVNMRLNYLGFLDVSAYGDERFANSGNAGLADMVLSLEWVRDNIALFGGDPANVTIIGQSGGGRKVTCLAALPAADGLFNRVYIMSGGASTTKQEARLAQTDKLVEYLGLTKEDDVIGTLKAMTYEELYNACKAAGVSADVSIGTEYYPTPWRDPETGKLNEYAAKRTYMVTSAIAETVKHNATLVIGRKVLTDDDMKIWKYNLSEEEQYALVKEVLGDKADAAIAAFKEAYPLHTDPYDVLAVANRATRIEQALACVDSGTKAYVGVAAYEMPWFGGNAMQHSGDIPFWFYSLKNVEYQIRGDEANAYAVSEKMAKAVAAFAATGDPSTDTLKWSEYTAENPSTMVFDVECYEKPNLDNELMDLLYGK